MGSGWIKLHRKIRDNPFWPKSRRYTPLEAWLDVLMSANHAPAKNLHGISTLVPVERGQFITSQVKLAERWRWNRKTVKKFLLFLKKNEMLDIETKKGKPSKLVLGDPMPEDIEVLPRVEVLQRCTTVTQGAHQSSSCKETVKADHCTVASDSEGQVTPPSPDQGASVCLEVVRSQPVHSRQLYVPVQLCIRTSRSGHQRSRKSGGGRVL